MVANSIVGLGHFCKFVTRKDFYLKKMALRLYFRPTGSSPYLYLQRNVHQSTNRGELQSKNQYVPRRALLYIPGNDEKKLDKISKVDADCIIMDCEDGVAISQKNNARESIHKYIQKKDKLFEGKDCSVRVNGIDTNLFRDDLQTVLKGPVQPSTLLLPKVESPEHILKFSDALNEVCERYGVTQKYRLIIYVESAKSLLGLQSICEKALERSTSSLFDLDGIVFGSDDFCADIGATRTSSAREALFARQWTVTIAKAFNLQAIDVVYIDYKDLDGLRVQSIEGAGFGFTGKQVIHPAQVPIVQEAFSPSETRVKWATELVKAFAKHQKEGKGAFTFEGNMIDMPLLRQAENILRTASVTKKSSS